MTEIARPLSSTRGSGGSTDAVGPEFAILVRVAEYWTVSYRGSSFSVRDTKGFGYLQRLLQNPDQEFNSLDLEIGPAPAIAEAKFDVSDSLTPRRSSDAGPMLDAQAINEYRQKLRELKVELDQQRASGDGERGARTEFEIDFLTRELARALGLRGRARTAGSSAERARLNVTRAIRASIERISEHQSALAELLGRAIKTGNYCKYVPNTAHPLTWQFSLESAEPKAPVTFTGPLLPTRPTSFIEPEGSRTAFVGRDKEHSLLRLYLGRALRGEGKVLMLSGAPGVGKTRLANEIRAEASRNGFVTLGGSCQEQGASFSPFAQMLESALAQAPSLAFAKEVLGNDANQIARLLPQLHRNFADIPSLPETAPEQSRLMLFDSVVNVFERLAAQKPLLLMIDDLHWADEGTLSLLAHCARALRNRPAMFVTTHRDSEWDRGGPLAAVLDELVRSHMLEPIALGGLTQSAVNEMIRGLSGQAPPAEIVSFIYAGTEGNPFFVEELFRHLVEGGKLLDSAGQFLTAPTPADLSVPWNLRVVIGRRLARRSEQTLRILDIAAILGRSFTFELLEASTGADADSLLDRVEEAEWAGLIALVERYPDAQFRFSHELIRQAVLNELSAPRRQRLHLQVANAIERIYAAELEDHADELANQLWQAGSAADPERTIRYLSMAAKQALTRSAHLEAIAHLKRGLDLLRTERARSSDAQELELQLDLGRTLMSSKGYSDPEVLEAFARARKLCSQLEESAELASSMLGLWAFYLVRAEYTVARELAEEVLSRARRLGDGAAEMEAHLRLGVTLWYTGQPRGAREHLERCIELEDPVRDRAHAVLYGQDPGVAARVYLGLVLWQLGYPDQAVKVSQQGLEVARRLQHPLTLTFALAYSVWLHMERGGWIEFTTFLGELEQLSKARGFVLWQALSTMFQSILLAGQGHIDQALASAKAGITAYRATGAAVGVPMFLAFQGRLVSMFGDADDALALVREAGELARNSGELNSEAELLRLEGYLMVSLAKAAAAAGSDTSLAHGNAEKCFLRALEASRGSESKSHELRAAVSLARLWRVQGKIEQAREILTGVYEWFSEGRDTADALRAKALLAELA